MGVGQPQRVIRVIVTGPDDLVDLALVRPSPFVVEVMHLALAGTGVGEVALAAHMTAVSSCHCRSSVAVSANGANKESKKRDRSPGDYCISTRSSFDCGPIGTNPRVCSRIRVACLLTSNSSASVRSAIWPCPATMASSNDVTARVLSTRRVAAPNNLRGVRSDAIHWLAWNSHHSPEYLPAAAPAWRHMIGGFFSSFSAPWLSNRDNVSTSCT